MNQYITLALNIALGVFLLFGIIAGLIRGLRKTASRGIFLILTSILLLFITVPITSALLKIKVNCNLNIEEATLTGKQSIEDIVAFSVKSFLGEDFSKQNPEFVQVITNLPLVFINAIVYVLLFWICKYLFLPLNYLFYKVTFAPKKPKENLGFSAFGDDNNNQEPITNNNSNYWTEGLENLNTGINNDASLGNASQPQVQPLVNNEFPLNDSTPVEAQNLNPTQTNNVYSEQAPTTNNFTANTPVPNPFGKEGTFIKTEVETPIIEKAPIDINSSAIAHEEEPKNKKNKKQKIKVKKHRLLGGLVGALCGMFVMLNTFVPAYGFMKILKDTNNVRISNMSEEEVSLSSQTNGVTDNIIKSYDSSILGTVSTYSGLEGLAIAEFDLLTTKQINDKKINLRNDIKNIVVTAQKVDTFMGKYNRYVGNGNISDLTQEQISDLIKDAKDLLKTSKQVKLIDCVADYLIPVACTTFLNTDPKISDNQIINELAIDAIKTLNVSKNINAFDEVTNMIDLIDYLNKQGLLVKLLKNDFCDPIAIAKGLDADFGTQFTNKVFKLQTVNLTMPYLVNIGLNFLEESIKYGYVKNDATAEEVKNGFCSLVQNLFETARTLDSDSDYYLTTQTLVPIGKLLESARTSKLLNADTYKNLVSYAVDQLKDLFKGIFPAELEGYFLDNLLENIKIVDNWEVEMNSIHLAILKLRNVENGILGKVVEGKALRQGYDIDFLMKENVFENLGEALDILESTCLFGTDQTNTQISGVVDMFSSIFNYANTTIKKDVTNTTIQKITEVIDKISNNLVASKHTYNQYAPNFWKNELTGISTLVIDVYDMLQTEDVNQFKITESLGKAMDKAKNTTVMFSKDTTLKLVNVTLDIVKDSVLGKDYVYNDGSDLSNPQTLNDKICKLFNGIQDNLKSINTTEIENKQDFWQNELKYYEKLKNIADNVNTLDSIDTLVAYAPDLDYIMKARTIPQNEIFELVAFAVEESKVNETSAISELDKAINRTKTNIANTLKNNLTSFETLEEFWETELGHIQTLLKIKFEDDSATSYKVINNLSTIGKTLDNVIHGYVRPDNSETVDINEEKEIRKSYLITENDLRDILGSAIGSIDFTSSFDNKIKDYIQTAINSINANIKDTTNITNISFEKELELLKTMSELKVNKQMLSYPTRETTDTDITFQEKLNYNRMQLNKLGVQLDSIAYNTIKSQTDGLIYSSDYTTTSGNSKFITRNILSTLISSILDIAKVEEGNSQDRAYNNLIESIKTQIISIDTQNKTMSWQRELDFVNNLVALNADTVYTIDNAAENLGKNIDAIAFNYTLDSENNILYNDVEYIKISDNNYKCVSVPTNNGNSLLITRESLKTTVAEFLNSVKKDTTVSGLEKEQNEIINELVDNCSLKVANTNNQANNKINYYANFESSLTALSSLDSEINDINFDGIETLTDDTASNIDTMLNNYESKPITNIIVTRKIAKLILNKLNESCSNSLSTNAYFNKLISHYQTNIDSSSTTSEFYSTSETLDTNSTHNPFKVLKSTIA